MWVWGPWHQLCGAVLWAGGLGSVQRAHAQPSSGQLRGRPGLHGLQRPLAVLGQKQEKQGGGSWELRAACRPSSRTGPVPTLPA